MASNDFKQFLDRNESVINTTGHLVSFYQNNKIANNQKALAQLELVNASLIEKQNRIREKELEKLEDLKSQQQKDKEEQERKEKLKSKVLEMGPKTKALVQNIFELPKDKVYAKALLIRHTELNNEQLEKHKEVVNDINFYDYIFNIKSELNRARRENQNFEIELETFSSKLADLLINFQNIMVGAELLAKDPKDIYKEKNRDAEKFLSELIKKIKEELTDKVGLIKLQEYLKRFTDMISELYKYDKLHEPSEYPLPLNYEEAKFSMQVVKVALESEPGFIESIQECIFQYQNITSKKSSKLFIDKMERLINKSIDDFDHSDKNFIGKNLHQDTSVFFYDRVVEKLEELIDCLKKEKEDWMNNAYEYLQNQKDWGDNFQGKISSKIVHNAIQDHKLYNKLQNKFTIVLLLLGFSFIFSGAFHLWEISILSVFLFTATFIYFYTNYDSKLFKSDQDRMYQIYNASKDDFDSELKNLNELLKNIINVRNK